MTMHTEGKSLLITTQAMDLDDPILGFFHGWVQEFANHFKRIDVICLREGRHALPPNVFIHSLGKEDGENRLKYLWRFYRYFRQIFVAQKVEYVFFHMGAIYNILAAPFFLLRGSFGTQFYWWKAHGHINRIGKIALLFVDRVYTSTQSGFPIATKKRRIIGQAIDNQKFTMEGGRDVRKNEILFVGRITPVKHIEDFIETAHILDSHFPDLRWSIIGPVDDASYFKELEALIAEKGMAGRVVFCGTKTQDELVPLYQGAKIFLNTSRTESMDKTVLEAALCGCIPVTANVAFKELLLGTGLFLEEGVPASYAGVLSQLLDEENTALRTELRKRVMAAHSITTFTERIFHD